MYVVVLGRKSYPRTKNDDWHLGQSGSEYIDVQIHPGQNECADFYVSLYLNN